MLATVRKAFTTWGKIRRDIVFAARRPRAFRLDGPAHTTTALCSDRWDKRLMPLHCTFHKENRAQIIALVGGNKNKKAY
jgi:hypothetical protein